jgi:glutamate 5-kinase
MPAVGTKALYGRAAIADARRVVVKIGTNALTRATGQFHRAHFERLAEELLGIAETRELIVVSSGAIALGMERLGFSKRPRDLPGKQACAAVGQSRLMQAYEQALAPRTVAQILLTHSDVQDRRRYLNARYALERLIDEKVIPIINENDTVSVDEIKFGDNDTLAGLVTALASAEALIILSDVEGLYDADPRKHPEAQLVSEVRGVSRAMLASAGGAGSAVGTGGMATKLRAAMHVTELGARCVIASGSTPGVLTRAASGDAVGTLFEPTRDPRQARASWIARALKAKGTLTVDAGACDAVSLRQKSLLPSGITSVAGQFSAGDPVDLEDSKGRVFARGLSAYAADEVRKIAGCKTSQVLAALGYQGADEVVHRSNLVLLVD